MDEQEKISALEDLITKLTDVQHSYQAVIEKMARLQMEAEEVAPEVAEKLQPAFQDTSKDHETVSGIIQDLQFKVNQLRNEAS